MDKKYLWIAIACLLMVLLVSSVAPVMAKSPKKIPVTFTRTGTYVVVGDNCWYSEDAYHVRDLVVGFGSYSVIGEGIELIGDTEGIMRGNVNLESGIGHMSTDSHLYFDGGTFEGNIGISGTFRILPVSSPISGFPLPLDTVQHCVWQGKGEYKGWTLVLEYETVAGVASVPLIGYLLIL